MSKNVVWVSAGAASAVVAMLTPDADLVYCDTGSEHPDNARFLRDCETSLWGGRKVKIIKSARYSDTWDVFLKTRWLNGSAGARCTTELKRVPRRTIEAQYDVQYYGYTAEEHGRAEKFMANNPDVRAEFPLINRVLSKSDCLAIINQSGIELPMMYKLGYRNNNCIGCVKGGAGYWNKIRVDFPHEFDRMSKLEREIGASCIKGRYLDQLPPDAGNYPSEPDMACGLLCSSVIEEVQRGEVIRCAK